MKEAVLTLTGVGQRYGAKQVLTDLDLSLTQGSILAICGRSGGGKTSLLDLIAGLTSPSEGVVAVEGRVAYMPQQNLLLDWRTALENVNLPCEVNTRINGSAREWLTFVGLVEDGDKYPPQLSGGMKQRVALARSLCQEADLYLFDEPFSAIDIGLRLTLAPALRHALRREKKSAIVVTHHIDDALVLADTVIALGGYPSRIVYSTALDLDRSDPIVLRSDTRYQKIFEEVWRAL